MDPRYELLARNLVGYSVKLQPGERLLIEAMDVPDEMAIALVRAARERGGIPLVRTSHSRLSREMLLEVDEATLKLEAEVELKRMQNMQAYIALRGSPNIFENSDVPAANMQTALGIMRPVQNWRVGKTKWCVLRWPSPNMAQQAMTSTQAFEDFYFRVCTLDYERMIPGERALKALMDQTDRVHIKGPGTDLRFSLKGIGAVMCTGERNIPDGEVFSSPVKDSVEGVVQYNVPTVYQGISFDAVKLEFSQGKIVNASCAGQTKRLNEILDSDEGARYIGEFALGFNPHILEPIRDILFDEKIAGSFHFTPGQAYENEADNGNRSQVHWDMVCIQRPEYGGGEILFDGKLIRKDGLFVTEELKSLNPDYLLGARSAQ